MKPLLKVLAGQKLDTPPVWFMRQAGRHLPEYRALREKESDFISFCFNPEAAAEATLQPIRRYGMDGAILFADILLIPIALGRKVSFKKGIGPVLEPIKLGEIKDLTVDGAAGRLSPIYETVSRVADGLKSIGGGQTTLIGFCGGPWTVATYMIEGGGSATKEKSKQFAMKNPQAMNDLLIALADSSAEYLIAQAKAGAQVLKIFESWAEGLSPPQFETLVTAPTKRMVGRIRAAGITVPVLGFPRAAGLNAVRFAHETGVSALACGTDTSMAVLSPLLPKNMPLQGNLDPLALRIGGQTLKAAVSAVLADAKAAGMPHIFNLGHGVSPDVKIGNVHAVLKHIRSGQLDGEFGYV